MRWKAAARVTLFVTFAFILTPKAWGQAIPDPFMFSVRMGAQDTGDSNGKMATSDYVFAEYTFYNPFAFGVETYYFRGFDKVDEQSYKGVDDIGFYLSDKDLWSSKWSGTTLTARLAYYLPSSYWSALATQQYEFLETLSLRQSFGDRWSLAYSISEAEYGYREDEFTLNDTDIYNTLYRTTNRLALTWNILKEAHITGGGSVRTYYNTNDQFTNIYSVFANVGYDVAKNASIDFGVTMANKDSGPDPWNGPTYSDEAWGADGLFITFGTTIHI